MKNFTTIRELLDHALINFADAPAISEKTADGYRKTTYAQLISDVKKAASVLIAKGLTGKHIGITGINSRLWAIAYYAVTAFTGMAIPLPCELTEAQIEPLIAGADIDAVISDRPLSLSVPVIPLECLTEGETEAKDAYVPAPEDIAEMIFTSGTTGIPKCVPLTHANIISIASCEFTAYAGHVSICVLPLHHAFEEVCHLLVAPAIGMELYMCPSIRLFPVMVAESGCDALYLVPALADALLTRFGRFLDKAEKLDRVVCGGAPIPQALVDAYAARGVKLYGGYGLSECSPLVSLNVDLIPGSCGRIGSYCRVRIDADGEIQVQGKNVFGGYYKNDAATKAAFTEDGWLKTGDLGRLDSENHLFITGRIKNLIILSNGENVSPEEIEVLIVNVLSGQADALVYDAGDKLGAKIYAPGVEEEAVRKAVSDLNAALPPYQRIMKIDVTDEPLPVNATGKKVR